jgi:hypothetical protein
VLLVIQQDDPVHEHGAGVGQMMAQPIENREPCVSMSPQYTTSR